MGSRIELKESNIQSANIVAQNNVHKLINAKSELTNLKNSLDHRVRARSSVDEQLRAICTQLDDFADKLDRIRRFVDAKSGRYFDIEDYLENRGLEYSKNYFYKYASYLAFDTEFILAARNAVGEMFSGLLNSDTLLWYKGLRFELVEAGGSISFKIVKGVMQGGNSWQYNGYRNSLIDLLGGNNADFKRRFVDRMINGAGIPLYVNGYGVIEDNMRRFDSLPTVSQYIRNLDKSPVGRFTNAFGSSFKDGMRVWDDFNWSNATNLSKFGKAFGAAGTVFTLGDNFVESFYSGGKWDFSEGKKDFAVNFGVDLAAGAGAMATGAAVGSFFLPPVGTVVGLGVGTAVNLAVNHKFGGPPPKSVVDHTKDFVNGLTSNPGDTLKNTADAIGDKIGDVGKKLDKIFW